MDNNITELVFILDCSGSMSGLEADTIGGFNSLIEKQRAIPSPCYVSTVLFNGMSRVLHDRLPLQRIPLMTQSDYTVGGATALLDTMGCTIRHIGNIHKYARPEDVPVHTLFVITTDGMDNVSRIYKADEIRQLVERQKQMYGWEFLFLGANMDAVSTARNIGISADRAVTYRADSRGTAVAYGAVEETIGILRSDVPLCADWSQKIEEDFRVRK